MTQRRSGGLGWMSGQPGCRPMRIRHYARMRDTGGDTVGQGGTDTVLRDERRDKRYTAEDTETG